ncbi:tyrosine phosphatase-like protein [Vararia minispora EC-137]|uniref:Tyrosine phosphatase-like protein n=1 Tax=Vararia minispora EC-137 TaxID=1314806 RepID=A0ACB8QL77_9AGAM|nr:tyrosine phosphatase-like protein [Vararia minispora EC-137]
MSTSHASHTGAKKTGPSFPVKAYLVLYNFASCAGWASVLYLTIQHLSTSPSTLQRLTARPPSFVPPELVPVYERATTTYAALGEHTKWVQTGAALEVVHSLLGFVRSPVQTTAMQVASRLYLVWGIANRFSEAQTSPLYATMVVSWSVTEVIRYSFYALGLLGTEPGLLLWLRYTTFYLLYPTGAGSEAFVCFATLPLGKPLSEWDAWAFGRGFLFLLWWPALYFLYSYMIVQRRKVFRSASTKAKAQ